MHYQDCLTRAREADAQADCTTSPDMAEAFRELAQTYRALAEQVQKMPGQRIANGPLRADTR
jgi:uncharacterized protein YecT (DUF1311 family)